MHFWIEFKPMLPSASHFCKKYKSRAQTLSKIEKNNVYLIPLPKQFIIIHW
jgi:hypothetical protein